MASEEVSVVADPPELTFEAEYTIGPGDILEINIWKEVDMSRQVIVPPDGVISFPHSGSFKVNGKTVDMINRELTRRLDYILVDPVVTVLLLSVGSNKIYVIGKVNRPGEFPISGPTDVMQALAMGGGMAPFADQDSIKILRRVDGKLTAISFDYSDVADGDDLDQNILLNKGDVVVVP